MRSLGLANGGERDLHHLSLDVKAFHAYQDDVMTFGSSRSSTMALIDFPNLTGTNVKFRPSRFCPTTDAQVDRNSTEKSLHIGVFQHQVLCRPVDWKHLEAPGRGLTMTLCTTPPTGQKIAAFLLILLVSTLRGEAS
jgi:hypothetical protein